MFAWVGLLIAAATFGYLFMPQDGHSWVEVWSSRGGAWAIAAWLLALVCMSCGVRGKALRVFRWRQTREAGSEAAEEADDEERTTHRAG
jgi:hypothetical protein